MLSASMEAERTESPAVGGGVRDAQPRREGAVDSSTVAAPVRVARLLGVAAVVFLLVAPLAVARYPPVLDLAQQSAQTRLLRQALEHPEGPYEIQWSSPNKLSYPLLAMAMAIGGVEWGPRLGLLACSACFVAGIFWLTKRLRRPWEHALLASVFAYSSALYGGFFNFLVGALFFAIWLGLQSAEEPEADGRRWVKLFAAAIGLYLSHVLWLAAAAYLVVVVGPRHGSWRERLRGLLVLSPLVAATALWYFSLRDDRWGTRVRYEVSLLDRLADWHAWLLGGLRGRTEIVLLLGIGIWLAFGFRRGNPQRGEGDRWLAKVALALLALCLVLPEMIGDTTLLFVRFGPWAAVCAVLACPPPGWRARWHLLVPGAAVLAFALVTTTAWREFDRKEMAGFGESLAAVPDRSSLLELDFVRFSRKFWLSPFFQNSAYAQLDREVRIGYSFASTPSSLVVYKTLGWTFPWTRGLEMHPEWLAPSDLDQFDYVLLHANELLTRRMSEQIFAAQPVAGNGDWHLFRGRRGAD